MRIISFLCLTLFGVPMMISTSHAKERGPEWLRAALSRPQQVDVETATAVTLVRQGELEVTRDGVFVDRLRVAVRILGKNGREHARAVIPYLENSDKVRFVKAWIAHPNGEVVAYGRDHVKDMAVYDAATELHGESRVQSIVLTREVVPQSVFAFEAEVERRSAFCEMFWTFQVDLPVDVSTFSLALPAGWTATGRMINRPPRMEALDGAGRKTWTLTQLKMIRSEPLAPPYSSRLPKLALQIHPPPDQANLSRRAFRSWQELGHQLTERFNAANPVDAEIQTKALELVSLASPRFDRLAALGRFAQQVNYISITLDTANWGGFTPRPAARVLASNYGDCKDKSILLQSLLSVHGIRSYPVLVHTEVPELIDPEWPAPAQFNHCVLAIEVDEATAAPAVVRHPKLGRLLIFDPTDSHLPLGQISSELAGGRGLTLAGQGSDLIALPQVRPEQNKITRRIEATLDASGRIEGQIEQTASGAVSSVAIYLFRENSPSDYKALLDRWLGQTLGRATITDWKAKESWENAEFSTRVSFNDPSFGRLAGGQLLIFRPAVLARPARNVLLDEPRQSSVVLDSHAFSEETRIALPKGYVVDEIPSPIDVVGDLGEYRASVEVEDSILRYRRSYKSQAKRLPANEYSRVQEFFERIETHESAPVVLRPAAAGTM